MEEAAHIVKVLSSAKDALKDNDFLKMSELSSQTTHSASCMQDAGSITIAVLIYALSKLIERKDYKKMKNWSKFSRKFNGYLNLAIISVKNNNNNKYEDYLQKARESLKILSLNFKPYIEEVLRKAAINKASRIYEHGISRGRTAQLLGVTEWEVAEYTGQKPVQEKPHKINTKKRAEMALEFFS